MSSRKYGRRLLSLLLVGMLFVFSACTSGAGGNDVTNAYNEALNQMQKGNNAKATDILSRISFHEDSAQLAQYCSALAMVDEGKYDEALHLFQLLDNYRDSRQCYVYYQAKQADTIAVTPAYRAYAASLYDQDSIAGYKDAILRAETIRSEIYQDGITAEEGKKDEKGVIIEGSEEWVTALECFKALGAYKDSITRAAYVSGRINEVDGDQQTFAYVNAVNDFNKAGNYKDSVERLEHCLQEVYEKADQLIASGEFDDAAVLYTALGNHCDNEKMIALKQARIAKAEIMINDGFYDDARASLLLLGETEKADYAWYQKAAAYEKEKKYDEAREVYLDLKDHDKADGAWYQKAAAYEEEKKYDEAREVYLDLKDHDKADGAWYQKAAAYEEEKKYDEAREVYLDLNDSDKADEAWYQKATALEEDEKTAEAAELYMLIRNYQDSRKRHYDLGVSVMELDPELAAEILLADQTYSDAADKLYEIADKASEESRYPLSIKVFNKLGNCRDSALRLTNDLYLYGISLMDKGLNDAASEVFDTLTGIGSADEYADIARYAAAEELEKNGFLDAAATAFTALKGYSDAEARARKCLYASAREKKAEGQYDNAANIFLKLGKYENSVEEEKDCRYLKAQSDEESFQWEEAIALYEKLGDYRESATRCTECHRQLGGSLLADGKAEQAYQEFVTAGDKDGQVRAAFMIAESKTADMNLEEGLEWYRLAIDYPETEERTSAISQMLLNMDEDDLSEQYASVIPGSEEARKVFYSLAIRSLERQDETAAMRLLQKAGDNADASERFKEMMDNRISILVSENKYEDAANLCASFGDQERADSLMKQKAEKEEAEKKRITEENRIKHRAKIEEADALLENGEYDAAAKIYTEIGETELAENALARKNAAEEEKRAKAEEEEREKVKACINEGDDLLAAGDYDGAIAIYKELGNQELVNEAIYQKAAGQNQPDLYMEIADYKDSREKHYLAGAALMDSDPERAYQILAGDIEYPGTQSALYELADRESAGGDYALSSAIFSLLSHQPLDPVDLRPDCAMRAIQDIYQYGLDLKEKGDYELAAVIFQQISGLGKAQERANESYYAIAESMEKNEKYAQAAAAFEALENYSDAPERARRNRYEAAKSQLENGRYAEAEKAFTDLGGYMNAATMVKQSRYLAAKTNLDAGKYEEALNVFAALDDYEDAGTMRQECQYLIACSCLDNQEYESALSMFSQIEDYKESSGKMNICREALGDQLVQQAETLLAAGDTINAAGRYETAYNYYHQAGIREKDETSAAIIASCYQLQNDLNRAVEWYEKAGEAGKKRILEIAQYAVSTEQYEFAETLHDKIETVESKKLLYEIAEKRLANGEMDEAIRLFADADDYSDAKGRHDELLYQHAENLINNHEYLTAIDVLETIPDYEGAAEKKQEALYAVAANQELTGNEDAETKAAIQNAKLIYANDLIEKENYEAAIEMLQQVDQTPEITIKVHSAQYKLAEAKEAAGDFESAIAIWSALNGYNDATERIAAARYQEATDSKEAQEYDKAIELLQMIPDYKNASDEIVDCQYLKAGQLTTSGDFNQALTIYQGILFYKDVKDILKDTEGLSNALVAWQHDIQPGCIVLFGHMETGEPNSWIVLDRNDNCLFLISENVIEDAPFMEEESSRTTWEHSTIRSYLNEQFLINTFDEDERQAIQLSNVKAEKSPNSDVSPGNNTEDYVFILNRQEADQYQMFLSDESTGWWLRSPAGSSSNENLIQIFSTKKYSSKYSTNICGIRPVIWVRDDMFLKLEGTFSIEDKDDPSSEDTNNLNQTNGKPWMGVSYRGLSNNDIMNGWPCIGMLILKVDENSPAEKAGLQPGDIITKIDNINDVTDNKMVVFFSTAKPGEKVRIEYQHPELFQINSDNSYTFVYEETSRSTDLILGVK